MFDAVIVAGSPNTGPLRECSDMPYEAMIRIGGKPMVRYVVDALLESGLIHSIAIAGPVEMKEIFPEEQVTVVQAGGEIVENAVKAMSYIDNTRPVLIVTSDIPLLTAEAVRNFISLCGDRDADFYYPIVSMDMAEERYPGVSRTSAKLKEGTFTGGNLFLVNPAAVPLCADRAREFVKNRKSPLKLCRLLGFKFIFKLLFNRLTIPELQKKVSEILGIMVKAVITDFPEIGIDVDKPSDYILVNAYLDKPA
ncbi:MAG: hypothetical protein CVU89_09330 [Firmicutes bacterium HGW-Firmicutes-14]|nr:MAG: hypothetical protein CVU89_09330 [Firmicutes bacterium HGW-Firmicutes-14]